MSYAIIRNEKLTRAQAMEHISIMKEKREIIQIKISIVLKQN